jgi:hypothetical protein
MVVDEIFLLVFDFNSISVYATKRKQKSFNFSIKILSYLSFFILKMLMRLNLIRRGYYLSQIIRPIHITASLSTINNDPIPPRKKEPVTTPIRLPLSASEISEAVLKRLHFGEQRGVVKALIIGSGIVIVSTVLFLYVFRKPIRNQTVAQVADVAKSSLEQGKFYFLI